MYIHSSATTRPFKSQWVFAEENFFCDVFKILRPDHQYQLFVVRVFVLCVLCVVSTLYTHLPNPIDPSLSPHQPIVTSLFASLSTRFRGLSRRVLDSSHDPPAINQVGFVVLSLTIFVFLI
jgi:hypothetical protein